MPALLLGVVLMVLGTVLVLGRVLTTGGVVARIFKLTALVTLLCGFVHPTWASFDVNGAGFGNASVSVWCSPNAPPNPPNYMAAQNGVFFPSPSLGPNLAGCNAVTQISLGTRAVALLFGARITFMEGGGDITGYDGEELLPLVTPTSVVSSGSLDMEGDIISSTSVLFTGSWSGSDAGVAQRLEFFDVSNPSSPRLLDVFNNSDPMNPIPISNPITRVGPFSESFSFLVTGITNVSGTDDELRSNLRVRGSGIGTSIIPEPSTLTLIGISALGMTLGTIVRRRRVAGVSQMSRDMGLGR